MAALRGARQLVDTPPRGCDTGSGSAAADRTGVAADVCTLAESVEKVWRWLREHVLTLHRLASDWEALRERVNAFLDQFADKSQELLQYGGLAGKGKLA